MECEEELSDVIGGIFISHCGYSFNIKWQLTCTWFRAVMKENLVNVI